MKKSKRSFELEDQESGPSKKGGAQLEKHEDEDIIDLEDIIEFDGQPEEEDELDLGVELIDLEADMDFKDLGGGIGTDDDALEEELLRDLPVGRAVHGKRDRRDIAPPEEEDAEDFLKGFSLSAGESKAAGTAGRIDLGEDNLPADPLEGLVFGADEKPEAPAVKKVAALQEVAAPDAVQTASKTRGATPPEDAPVDDSAAQHPGGRTPRVETDAVGAEGTSLDGLVDDIETRLAEMVREMVEARLPDIVRTVLKEEIQKLKAELKS